MQMTLGGAVGSTVTVKVRLGGAWATGPVIASQTVRKSLTGYETRTFEFLNPTIVLEVTGYGLECVVVGSYVGSPSANHPPLYPEPLYFQGSRFLNNGWRIGFQSFVQPHPPCVSDFNEDGGVNGDDVAAFLVAWESGDIVADVADDGGLDGQDVLTFFEAWERSAC
ncbi:MAG: hypothetical protein JSR77_09410 [Planctomycetes bacterium]|nr:hypothetical protein [Planctomycetota bacterium]